MEKNSVKFYDITNEEKLILLCAHTKLSCNNKIELLKILKLELDWDFISKSCLEHRLTSLLFWNLKEYADYVPNNIFNSIKTVFDQNTKNNLLLLGEMLKILYVAKKEDIMIIPYKGPLLAIMAYKNLVLREFDDLDIYLKKNDVIRAKNILISNGYNPQFELKKTKENIFINSQREYKFFNPKTGVKIELQWHFSGVSFSLSENLDYFIDHENIKWVKIYNKEISSISPENTLLILCIHISGHLWERLSWICDISELIKSHEINWDYVLKKAEKLRIKRILMINLKLAHDLLDLNLPNEIYELLNTEIVIKLSLKVKKRIFNQGTVNLYETIKLRYSIRERRIDGIKDIFKIMFLPTNLEWDNSRSKPFFPPISYIYRFINVLKDL